MRKTTKKEHYVNNKEFLQAMIEYRKMVNKAKKKKKTKPPVTDYIGSCFLKIANHYHTDLTLLIIHLEMI